MFSHLQIPYRDERWLVGLADAGLRALTLAGAPFRSARAGAGSPRRILLLRLERVGDLLMVLDAIAMVRASAPDAEIHLVAGSWNLALARLIPSVDSIETLDVPWLARGGRGLSWPALVRRARAWRAQGYDLAINFEPDIRSNILLAMSGAPRRVGFVSGGGGAVLTDAIAPDPRAHIAANAKALVASAFGERETAAAPLHKLRIPEEARRRAAELLAGPAEALASPANRLRRGFGGQEAGHYVQEVPAISIGIQPAAGRQIKEWDPARFAEVGAELARTRGAKIVLIGSADDRAALDAVRAAWPADVPLAQLPLDTDLVDLAAVLERLALFITGDTGPMHLAAAVGTPVLAIFGPSWPTRYAPLSQKSRIVRIDIPCSPCNLMRRPPERCVGHVPDCLSGIESAQVLEAASEMLDA